MPSKAVSIIITVLIEEILYFFYLLLCTSVQNLKITGEQLFFN
jgi:hypothetical protein